VSLDELIARDPSPQMVSILNEEWQRLFALLPDDACRKIVQWKMEEHTDEEIADRLGITDRTVRRKMQLVRALWGDELARETELGTGEQGSGTRECGGR
jgi:DNA-directed RNA polymerase specialized sigma24 family protein